jgi:hypothetical protein
MDILNLTYTDLSNICIIKTPRFRRSLSNSCQDGLYNFYTGGNIKQKSNFNDIQYMTILLNRHKNSNNIFIDENCSCSNNYLLLNLINNNSFNLKFIYYYIKLLINFEPLYRGAIIQNLYSNSIRTIQIPIIDYNHQLEIANILDEYFSIFNIDEVKINNFNNILFNILLNREYERLYVIRNNTRLYIHTTYI